MALRYHSNDESLTLLSKLIDEFRQMRLKCLSPLVGKRDNIVERGVLFQQRVEGLSSMDRFTLEVLARTIDFAIEAIPPDENPRIVDCVVTIRDYLQFPGRVSLWKLRAAIVQLLGIAHANCQFIVVARLTPIAQQLDVELDRDVA